MHKHLLVEVLSSVSVSHVWLITNRAVEVFYSLLFNGDIKVSPEAVFTKRICAPRHYDHLCGKRTIICTVIKVKTPKAISKAKL